LFVVFIAVTPLIYLNLVGLPEFLKTSIANSLKRQGFDLAFETMRLLPSGIVVDRVSIVGLQDQGSPRLVFEEVLLDLSFAQVLRGRVEVEALRLRKGRFNWPLRVGDQPAKALTVDHIGLDLRVGTNDVWSLEPLEARWLGARLHLGGTLTNASYLRDLGGGGERGPRRSPDAVVADLYRLAQIGEQVHFGDSTEIDIQFSADARALENARGLVHLRSGGVETPWASVGELGLKLLVNDRPPLRSFVSLDLRGRVAKVRSAGFALAEATWEADLSQCLTNAALISGSWNVATTNTVVSGVDLGQVLVKGTHESGGRFVVPGVPLLRTRVELGVGPVRHAAQMIQVSNVTARIDLEQAGWMGLGQVDLRTSLEGATTRWGTISNITWAGHVAPQQAVARGFVEWTDLSSFRTNLVSSLDLAATGLVLAEDLKSLAIDRVQARAEWRGDEIRLRELDLRGFGGLARFSGLANFRSGAGTLDWVSTLDPLSIWGRIDGSAMRWLEKIELEAAPELRGSAHFQLPRGRSTGSEGGGEMGDWWGGVGARASLNLGRATAYGVRFESIESEATWSNRAWAVPRLRLRHERGWVEASLGRGVGTNTFLLSLRSELDPGVLKPLFNERTRRTLDALAFGAPPRLSVEATGDWGRLEEVTARGELTATNVSYQGNLFHHLSTRVSYGAPWLRFEDIRLSHADEKLSVDGMALDLREQWLYFTNGVTSMDVFRVTRMIGPKTTEAVEPYRFHAPPKVRVWGSLPLKTDDFTDMHFEIEGGPFSYWRFHVPQIQARVDWVTNTLAVSKVRASFYQGQMNGDFFFDFRKVSKGELRFDADFEKSDLRTLLADLTSPTNRADGVLEGKLSITSGLAADMRSWVGSGEMKLEQGYLWNVPLFSILSPVLNVVSPGLGNSRGGRSHAAFLIHDGQAHTEDLRMQEPTMRLRYRGMVDLDGSLNARVEAELLRNGWFPGRALSWALSPLSKLFEYKITGTLGQPKLEPLYFIPKVLLFPLNPYRGLKELFPEDSKPATKPAKE